MWADANADGAVDVNDGVLVARHALAGGPAPVCAGAGDLLGTGDIALGSSIAIWGWLFTGGTTTLPADPTCDPRTEPAERPPCARVRMELEVPRSAGGSSIDGSVTLRTKGVDPDAWSFALQAAGCRITSTSFERTVAATTFDDPPGLVDEGFRHVEIVDDGVISAVVPSWMHAVGLPEKEGPHTLLRFTAESDTCGTCTLTLGGRLQGKGQPARTVVGRDGWSYPVEQVVREVKVCP